MIRSRFLSKCTQKALQTAFFSDDKIFKVKRCGLRSEEIDESPGARGKIILQN